MTQLVAACHSKACAPPPAGKGGSTKGGKRSGRRRQNKVKSSSKAVKRAAFKSFDRSGGKDVKRPSWTIPGKAA